MNLTFYNNISGYQRTNNFKNVLPPKQVSNNTSNTITDGYSNTRSLNAYRAYALPEISFGNNQKTPITDEEYNNAKDYLSILQKSTEYKDIKKHLLFLARLNSAQGCSSLSNCEPTLLDFSKEQRENLNGIQKDIKVFEGLTINEIASIMSHPAILLNRGCNNGCAHCLYDATPISDKTLDRMSYEDFKSLIDGIKELEKRLGMPAMPERRTTLFLDSDCINIELKDKDGKIYDYVDCLKEIGDIKKLDPILDTSGWNPKSEKYQKRAEKFVNYIMQPEILDIIDGEDTINISINPYHSLCTKAEELRKAGNTELAAELENRYVDRMANVLFTFTPLLNTGCAFNILSRALPADKTNTDLNEDKLKEIEEKIFSRLEQRYKEDLTTEQRYIKSKDEIKNNLEKYQNIVSDDEIVYEGRAKQLFKTPDYELKDCIIEHFNEICYTGFADSAINPNGKVFLCCDEISKPTDIQLNFENKGKPVKPIGCEID